jgi:hypothetical protein
LSEIIEGALTVPVTKTPFSPWEQVSYKRSEVNGMPRKNLYLQSEAISDHVNLGLAAALEELESSSASALWIVSSTMAQLKHSDLSQALGEASALVLAKGRRTKSQGQTGTVLHGNHITEIGSKSHSPSRTSHGKTDDQS